jgi:UDP-N-acetylmuramyl pentapeptide phosphotransferase/UDP-N-acetylglucosamine-1-phosphate transferase
MSGVGSAAGKGVAVTDAEVSTIVGRKRVLHLDSSNRIHEYGTPSMGGSWVVIDAALPVSRWWWPLPPVWLAGR